MYAEILMPKVLKEISFLLKLIKNLNPHMKTDIDWKLKIALENVILLNLSLEDLMSFRKSRLNAPKCPIVEVNGLRQALSSVKAGEIVKSIVMQSSRLRLTYCKIKIVRNRESTILIVTHVKQTERW